jgi:twitching motility protein PilT
MKNPADKAPPAQRSPLAVLPGGGGIVTPQRGLPKEAPHKIDMKYLVRALIKYNASDLHIKVGRPPLYRINGKLIPANMPELSQEQTREVVAAVLTDRQLRELEDRRQVEFSFRVKELGRFRCSVFYQRGMVSAAIRMVPMAVPNLDNLGIPPVIKELCNRPRGLLVVTGATGSGKSTTLAAMINHLNETTFSHILTIEDPIEFVYRDMKASVTQREVGSDTNNLHDALISGLRQDPDVIMIGEIRDVKMIQAAITAAETGHLVMTTLHTNDAKSTISRIIDVFPHEAKNQVRIQLASTLVGVVAQQLLPRADGNGQVPACEVMVKSPIIQEHILNNEIEKIPEAIANSSNYYKMQTMNSSLEKLVRSGTITLDEAIRASSNPDDLRLKFSGVTRDEGYHLVGQNTGKPPGE